MNAQHVTDFLLLGLLLGLLAGWIDERWSWSEHLPRPRVPELNYGCLLIVAGVLVFWLGVVAIVVTVLS